MSLPSYNWWIKSYFCVLFSPDLWLSWYFVFLGFSMFCGIWETAYPFVHATKSLFVLFIAFVFTALALTQALSKVKKRLVEKEYDEGRINRNQELAGIYTGEPGPNERAYTGEVFTDENGI